MSKQTKRKITVELPKCKELAARPSVFDRLGTKKAAKKGAPAAAPYALGSPSKQPDKRPPVKEEKTQPQPQAQSLAQAQSRLHSAVVVRGPPGQGGPGDDWMHWDQQDLEYADADALEKRREQLKRELDMQTKMESVKDHRKEKKKPPSSSSSSRSSSSTSVSTSTSGGSTSSSSSARETRKKIRKIKSKRNSSSSSGSDRLPKKKLRKDDSLKRDKSNAFKRAAAKKDDRTVKKHDPPSDKKKTIPKPADKKSLSPAKKSGGTPPISNKNIPKGYQISKNRTRSRSPKKDKNKSSSPHLGKDREKEKEREREKERDRLKEREKERERERERDRDRDKDRKRSKSPRSKARSRSPLRRHGSHPPRDPRRRDSPAKSRGSSPKGRGGRQDSAADKHRSRASPRDDRKDDKRKDYKDRSLERRKDKHDDKDRHDRDRKEREQQRLDREAQREKEREEALARCQERQRERERLKEQSKRDQDSKRGPRGRDRDRGLNKGLEKPGPDKPVERLLPRPEERLAALAATNKSLGLERAMSSNRDRADTHSDRNSRKADRSVDRDRIERLPKRQNDRRNSTERTDRSEYGHSLERTYDHSHSMDRSYDRSGERYDDIVSLDREREDRSPGVYPIAGHDRDLHYGSPYDMHSSHSRGYMDPDERVYSDHLDDHHTIDRNFIEDRRNSRRDDLSWDGRETSVDPDRQYIHHSQMSHSHKDWDNEDYHSDWNRQDRHWQHRDSQHKGDWQEKDRDLDGNWHSHRQNVSSGSKSSRSRAIDEPNYRSRTDHNRSEQSGSHAHSSSKRSRDGPSESDLKKPSSSSVKSSSTHSGSGLPPHSSADLENAPVPDDLSEISDDADEILNRDDELSEVTESAAVASEPSFNQTSVDPYGIIDLQTFKPDYEPMIEHVPSKGKSSKDSSSLHKNDNASAAPKENNVISENKNDHSQEHDGEDGLDNLDFEEISDGELEEDQRAKGLGDALGVDWASLVAEVRKKKESNGDENDNKNKTGAREYWQPQKVLARIGVSLQLAGEAMINEIFNAKKEGEINQEVITNGNTGFKISHPVASIQVALERRRQQRISLFGTETGFTRALCARRDLALRRYLCDLPVNEYGHEIHPPEPHLFAMAQKLIQKAT